MNYRHSWWLTNSHVRRYCQHYGTAGLGHLYQGRFKSFPIENDELHLLNVLRYVESNARRAGLVDRAEDWRWGSLWHRNHGDALRLLDEWPIERPPNWIELVNEPLPDHEAQAIRGCVVRGSPLGSTTWVQATAAALGLGFTLRPRGRPRKKGTSRLS